MDKWNCYYTPCNSAQILGGLNPITNNNKIAVTLVTLNKVEKVSTHKPLVKYKAYV